MEIICPTFCVTVIKIVWQQQLEKERVYFGSNFQGPVHHGGKSGHQDLEATGPVASTIKKREMNVCTQLTFSFLCSPGSLSREWYHPQWVGLLTSVNLFKIIRSPGVYLLGNSRAHQVGSSVHTCWKMLWYSKCVLLYYTSILQTQTTQHPNTVVSGVSWPRPANDIQSTWGLWELGKAFRCPWEGLPQWRVEALRCWWALSLSVHRKYGTTLRKASYAYVWHFQICSSRQRLLSPSLILKGKSLLM